MKLSGDCDEKSGNLVPHRRHWRRSRSSPGANVTTGYEHNGEANQTAFIRGWFRTGDQGYFDSDGYLFLTGRLKELINCGGSEASPLEVEAVLSDHPAGSEAVAPICYSTLGEDVAAAVVVKSGSPGLEAELRGFAARRLADFKVPRHIELVERIPRSATGKVQRDALGVAAWPETARCRDCQSQETRRLCRTAHGLEVNGKKRAASGAADLKRN